MADTSWNPKCWCWKMPKELGKPNSHSSVSILPHCLWGGPPLRRHQPVGMSRRGQSLPYGLALRAEGKGSSPVQPGWRQSPDAAAPFCSSHPAPPLPPGRALTVAPL